MRLYGLTEPHLRNTRCESYPSEMRVLVEAPKLYTYPDFSVVCGEPRFADGFKDILLNSVLIAEILSPSTENYDRAKKLRLYWTIPSLRECLLISQERPDIELSRRNADGTWTVIEARALDASIELTSIGYTLRLRELYDRILPAEPTAPHPTS